MDKPVTRTRADYVGARVTPAESLIVERASAEWAPTVDELALAAALDDCEYLRAYGGRDTRTLDTALRIKRDVVERVQRSYQARQLEATRQSLRRKT